MWISSIAWKLNFMTLPVLRFFTWNKWRCLLTTVRWWYLRGDSSHFWAILRFWNRLRFNFLASGIFPLCGRWWTNERRFCNWSFFVVNLYHFRIWRINGKWVCFKNCKIFYCKITCTVMNDKFGNLPEESAWDAFSSTAWDSFFLMIFSSVLISDFKSGFSSLCPNGLFAFGGP